MASKTPFRMSALAAGARRRGFTAIEISAVATIIAILALILIPIVRKRVDESKIVAAQDDMVGIEKAELMAFGQTGQYFRLQDLDRPEPTQDELIAMRNEPPATLENTVAAKKIPPAYWNRPLLSGTGETNYLATNWKGPYMTFNRSLSLYEVVANRPYLFRGDTPPPSLSTVTLSDGPMLIVYKDDVDWVSDLNGTTRRRYPTDPWGNPYLFFGSGRIGSLGGQTAVPIANQRDYTSAVIYSLGPDGFPSSPNFFAGNPTYYTVTENYYRETEILGMRDSDDLKREF